ncbi:MAG: DUF3037 domain-containing protein [Candidatus Limnocylindrales bacterium]
MPDGAAGMASGGMPFQYATLRVVPDVERGERINAGVVLLCRPARFLDARVHLDEGLLARLAPDLEIGPIRALIGLVPRLCAGDPSAGPIALLEPAERFHWIVAPSSTVVQPSAVHTGVTKDPAATLGSLYRRLVTGRDATER